ncbi:MAG: MAPEG family protein [Alphaproteobacteria bacterium]|nr:MAPEG family protein [Alphaproteobacteria bacterium SS10]
MNPPVITAILAAVLIIMQQVLLLQIGAYRRKSRIGVGFAEDPNLERMIRRHGNLAENGGLFLIVLALAELLQTPMSMVIAFAGVFFVARLLHAISFSSLGGSHGHTGSRKFLILRSLGAIGTALSGIVLGAYLLFYLLV